MTTAPDPHPPTGSPMSEVRILYDGECPVCTAYSRFTRLRRRHDVELVDARHAPELVRDLRERGVEIDEGMVVLVDGEVHHGDDAVAFLEMEGRWSLLPSTRWIRRLYPLAWRFRNLLLRVLGRSRHIDA